MTAEESKAMNKYLEKHSKRYKLVEDESKPKRPVSVERIEEIIYDTVFGVGSDGYSGITGVEDAAMKILAEINEGEK